MLILSIFNSIYELVLDPNVNYPEYRESIFKTVGLATLFLSIFWAVLFYLGINRMRSGFNKRKHWAFILLINDAINFGLTLFLANKTLELGSFDAYMYMTGIFNAVISTLIFVGLSFLLKKFSIHATHTPI